MNHSEVSYVSENGVKIYGYKNPSAHSFFISLFVRAGAMFESAAECGIAHFFEHISIRNINKIYGMELYRDLDRFGLEFNASTFSEMIQFYISGADKNFDRGADIAAKLFSPIVLDRAEIDAERKRIKAEIRESDDKSSLATFTSKEVFKNTSLENSIVGTFKSVDRITRKALEEYRRRVMSADNVFFYVTGNFTDKDIDYLISRINKENISAGIYNENVAPVPEGFGKRDAAVFVKNDDYTMVRFTFDLDMNKYSVAETDLIYDMLMSGYNSKLFIELSEKRGLCYDVSGACERYKNIGTLYFSYEVKGADLYSAIEVTCDVLDSIKKSPASDDMKAGYVDNAYMLYDDIRELNFTFGYDNHIMGENYSSIEERKSRYQNIDDKRLSRIASNIFTVNNLTVTMKGSKKEIDKNKVREILRRHL